jgi:hypothetical protein
MAGKSLIRKPYPLKKLTWFYEPQKLLKERGTIETAIIQEPKLLTYKVSFPKGFQFPENFMNLT